MNIYMYIYILTANMPTNVISSNKMTKVTYHDHHILGQKTKCTCPLTNVQRSPFDGAGGKYKGPVRISK